MSVTLQNIYNELDDYRLDTSNDVINQDTEIFRAVNKSLRTMQRVHDWIERKQTIVFNKGIDEYALNSDYKMNSPISLYTVDSEQRFTFVYDSDFDKCKNRLGGLSRFFSNRFVNQNRRIRIYGSDGEIYSLDDATGISNNGTWAVAGDALNLVEDDAIYKEELGSSLKFDINGTSAVISNITFAELDLEDVKNNSNLYLWVYLPTITNLSNIIVRFGEGASDYWTTTITTDYLENSLSVGWNRIKATWDSSSGSPDASYVGYFYMSINYSVSTSSSGFRINKIFVSKNIDLELDYYSENMVYDNSAATNLKQFLNDDPSNDYLLFLDDNILDVIVDLSLPFLNYQQEDDSNLITFNKSVGMDTLKTMMIQYPTRRARPISFARN